MRACHIRPLVKREREVLQWAAAAALRPEPLGLRQLPTGALILEAADETRLDESA